MGRKEKIKRRGFVMTGGGAKGLFEAGVIHAFHITGMEFDVITGSSIGAMNAAFFAEYLFRKRKLAEEIRATPERTIQAMEGLVRCYHRAWLLMPEKNIIDDNPSSPLGQLIGDLGKFHLSLADVTRAAWWWLDPKRGALPDAKVLGSVARILKDLVQRLGSPGELLRILKDHRQDILREATRTYLKRFRMERSVVPTGERAGQVIEGMFTQPVTPLQREHLDGPIGQEIQAPGMAECLISPARTFQDYAEYEIAVRLTRANYRTARLEISTYLSPENFIRYMETQAWRLEAADPEKMPLGSFRLQVPGNPNVIKAALASGRFPGVFAPFPFQEIYPAESKENELLYKLLKGWLEDTQVQDSLKSAYRHACGQGYTEEAWQKLLKRWQESETLRDFFPFDTDTYVDGGAIDNTPSNSAVDATREWITAHGKGKRDVLLDLYVVFLEEEPKISRDEAKDPLLTEVVQRTLAVQTAAVKTGDAVTVKTINSFGMQAEALARSLLSLLEALKETKGQIGVDQRRALEETVRQIAGDQGLRGYLGEKSEDILDRMETWARGVLMEKLPLHVEELRIYPDKMPLNTLAFTERLGYHKKDAIEMLTMGCYNTLWAMRLHLEEQGDKRDSQDEQVLRMAKKWMGFENMPDKRIEDYRQQLETLRLRWRCTRSECLYYRNACRKGLMEKAS